MDQVSWTMIPEWPLTLCCLLLCGRDENSEIQFFTDYLTVQSLFYSAPEWEDDSTCDSWALISCKLWSDIYFHGYIQRATWSQNNAQGNKRWQQRSSCWELRTQVSNPPYIYWMPSKLYKYWVRTWVGLTDITNRDRWGKSQSVSINV